MDDLRRQLTDSHFERGRCHIVAAPAAARTRTMIRPLRWLRPLIVTLLAASSACGTLNADGDAYRKKPGYVIDSILPIAEQLQRFRQGLDSVDRLTNGASSREELIRRFVHAVAVRDTAGLRSLILSQAEFAWVYYPVHPISRPPYEMTPQLFWFQTRSGSEKGISRLLDRLGGMKVEYVSHACPSAAAVEYGENRVHAQCEVAVTGLAARPARRLFGAIVERRSVFKFVSYANDY